MIRLNPLRASEYLSRAEGIQKDCTRVAITNKSWILLLGSYDSYVKLAFETKVTCPLGKITCPLVTCPLEKVTCPQKKLPAVAGKNGQKGGVMAHKNLCVNP